MKMKKTMTKLAVGAFLLAVPGIAAAASQGLTGDCVECHTMHNSEKGQPVAVMGALGTESITRTPIQNLLRMDCIACHVADPGGADNIIVMLGGSTIPQVGHADSTDLAGGNFSHIMNNGSRKGHNVSDLSAMFGTTGDDNGGTYGVAPGMYRYSNHTDVFSPDAATFSDNGDKIGTGITNFSKFTCAGAAGCHGTRSQVLSGYTDDNIYDVPDVAYGNGDPSTFWSNGDVVYDTFGNGDVITADGTDFYAAIKRVGIPAISGAHHNSYDGPKYGLNYLNEGGSTHDGQRVADGYRFIPGLWGYGNEAARWENVDAGSHNEYYGDDAGLNEPGYVMTANGDQVDINGNTNDLYGNGDYVEAIQTTGNCHIEGHVSGTSARMATTSTLRVPNNSMSGFCATCHGTFHSVGDLSASYITDSNGPNNGISGAFLRHPSDYIIPNSGEYASFTALPSSLSTLVARNSVYTAPSAIVTPGQDMVMCLSCHLAHASEYDAMLRFDYTEQQAGNAVAGIGEDCLACHTTKGILNR